MASTMWTSESVIDEEFSIFDSFKMEAPNAKKYNIEDLTPNGKLKYRWHLNG